LLTGFIHAETQEIREHYFRILVLYLLFSTFDFRVLLFRTSQSIWSVISKKPLDTFIQTRVKATEKTYADERFKMSSILIEW